MGSILRGRHFDVLRAGGLKHRATGYKNLNEMNTYQEWQYDEYRQVGKDYSQTAEVEAYDSSHAQFRDVDAENSATLAKLGLNADASVLDIGCGTGAFAIAAAKQCRKVVGIDVSQAMLDRARSNGPAASLEFMLAGYLDFDFPDESFDVVTSSFCLHHLPDYWKGIALARIGRCLTERGVFFLRDVVMPDEGATESVSAFIERQEKLGGEFLKNDAIGHFRDEFSTYDWVMRGLIERAGFTIEKVDTMGGVVREYFCRKRL